MAEKQQKKKAERRFFMVEIIGKDTYIIKRRNITGQEVLDGVYILINELDVSPRIALEYLVDEMKPVILFADLKEALTDYFHGALKNKEIAPKVYQEEKKKDKEGK